MNIIELAKWNFEGLNEIDNPMMCAALPAFAQAVIEDYKASLVPVAWYKPNGNYYDGFILGATKLLKHVDSDEYTIELFALPSGETK